MFDANTSRCLGKASDLSGGVYSLDWCGPPPHPRFLSGCLAVWLSGCLAVWLPACLPACLSACLSACLPVCLPACLSVCLPACLPACLPVLLLSHLATCTSRVQGTGLRYDCSRSQ